VQVFEQTTNHGTSQAKPQSPRPQDEGIISQSLRDSLDLFNESPRTEKDMIGAVFKINKFQEKRDSDKARFVV